MFGDVVLGVDHHHFEEILELAKEDRGYMLDTELSADDWAKVIEDYKAKVLEETGKPFPQDPKDQVWAAIGAVFGSWMNQRAKTYRRLHNIPAEWGPRPLHRRQLFLRRISGQRPGRGRGGRHPHPAEPHPARQGD